MTIRTLIARQIPPLRLDDTVEHALGLLLDHSIYHIPVVNGSGRLVGSVSEDLLLNAAGPEAPIASLIQEDPGTRPVQVLPDTHVFEATKVLVKHALTAVPVVEASGEYVGLLRRHDIFEQFARMLSTQESGAILALELVPRDYSLSQLVYTIENNDVKILSIASEPPDSDTGMIRVTIKLNTTDATRVRHMLEHHGYHVVASFSEEETDEDLQWRVQEFMRYLEV
jgi:acetoin utilization protein AcuB